MNTVVDFVRRASRAASFSSRSSSSHTPSTSTSTSTSTTTSDTGLTISTENEYQSIPCNQERESFLSLISLICPAQPQQNETKRTPIDLVAVLDRSGSMQGEKMTMLHKTVQLLINHMSADDKLSLVSYDDRVDVNLDLTKMDEAGKKKARTALQNIQARGSTDLCAGVIRGLDVLDSRSCNKNEVSSVLLMTDGLVNHGVQDSDMLVAKTRSKIEGMKNPTSLYTFGFGSDHDATLLTQLSSVGRGSYYFMQTTDAIPQAFADCIGGLMSVVAQNIDVAITAAPGFRIRDIITNFPKSTTQLSNNTTKFTVRVGDIFSEERKDLLVDLYLPVAPSQSDNQTFQQTMLHIEVSYFDIASVSTLQIASDAHVTRTSDGSQIGAASVAVDEQRNRVETAKAMETAMRLGDSGNVDQARQLLQECKMKVLQSRSKTTKESVGYVQDIDSVMKNMSSVQDYQEVAQKKLNVKSRKHWVQRATECDASESNAYTTSAKMATRSKFSAE